MSSPQRDPELVVKRVILAVWSAVILFASAFGFIACLIGILNEGHPILIGGALGCLLGIVAGLYLGRLALTAAPPAR